jgi:MFS family permease
MKFNSSVARLAFAQALSGANSTVVYATGAIIGNMLSPRSELATLPISLFVVGMAASTLPVGSLTRRFGRHAAFLAGNLCGVLVGLLAAAALVVNSFALYCIAMLFGGAYAAVVLTFRFAAAECVPPAQKSRALSIVMAGGVAAGVVGPQLVSATMNLWSPHAYAVTYIAAAAVAIVSALVLRGVRFEREVAVKSARSGRPAHEILRRPQLLIAMLCGVVSYMTMNFMMTSAPLAMELCGIPRLYANYGIEMHVIAMYAPSFITGRLIERFGALTIVMTGLGLTALAAVVGIGGESAQHFWGALVLLGLGWNFGFLGASAMVLASHAPDEAPRVQSINDFVVFGAMVVGSFVSGSLLVSFGWPTVTSLMLPPVFVAALGLMWLLWAKPRAVTR